VTIDDDGLSRERFQYKALFHHNMVAVKRLKNIINTKVTQLASRSSYGASVSYQRLSDLAVRKTDELTFKVSDQGNLCIISCG
jgi:hypothetical protein